jgi:hypothetical protein
MKAKIGLFAAVFLISLGSFAHRFPEQAVAAKAVPVSQNVGDCPWIGTDDCPMIPGCCDGNKTQK